MPAPYPPGYAHTRARVCMPQGRQAKFYRGAHSRCASSLISSVFVSDKETLVLCFCAALSLVFCVAKKSRCSRMFLGVFLCRYFFRGNCKGYLITKMFFRFFVNGRVLKIGVTRTQTKPPLDPRTEGNQKGANRFGVYRSCVHGHKKVGVG